MKKRRIRKRFVTTLYFRNNTSPPKIDSEPQKLEGVDIIHITVEQGILFSLGSALPSTQDLNKIVEWKSSDENVATVSPAGLVRGVNIGEATISVTTSDGKSEVVSVVSVKEPFIAVERVKLNKKAASVKKGKKLKLKATISRSNATNKGVVWKSSNKKIAKVSSKGVVKGIRKGKAKITVKTEDGKKKATCKLTVK